ncbi:MAG: M15 family metallopeptidase [Cyanobacteria bacterium J06627_28]
MSNLPPSSDVPPARRESTEISLAEIENLHRQPEAKRRGGKKIAFLLVLAGLGGGAFWQWERISPYVSPYVDGMKSAIASTDFSFLSKSSDSADSSAASTANEPTVATAPADRSNAAGPDTDSINLAIEDTNENPDANGAADDELLGHRRYDTVSEEALVQINPDSNIKVQPDVQDAVNRMIEKARIEGVQLDIISGFRTLEDQQYLYFDLKAERGQSVTDRATVSAPPGYSEHHTGYAVDFIDPSQPDTHLEESFETTAAFRWLEKNSPYFNFELSFPKDNASGVSYEPWHWRYVGNQESLELFYR